MRTNHADMQAVGGPCLKVLLCHLRGGLPIHIPSNNYDKSGGLCASVTHFITVPIDVVKTRQQVLARGPQLFDSSACKIKSMLAKKDSP
jgi:hypothetical protein